MKQNRNHVLLDDLLRYHTKFLVTFIYYVKIFEQLLISSAKKITTRNVFLRTLSGIYEDLSMYEPSFSTDISLSLSAGLSSPVVAQSKSSLVAEHKCCTGCSSKPKVSKPLHPASTTPYKKRPEIDICCDTCGCTIRELVKLIYNNHQDCKNCYSVIQILFLIKFP